MKESYWWREKGEGGIQKAREIVRREWKIEEEKFKEFEAGYEENRKIK